jgi:hypothetical protein
MNAVTILPMQANQGNTFAVIWIPWLRDTMKRGKPLTSASNVTRLSNTNTTLI